MKINNIYEGKQGEKLFLLGNEAAVRGALEAGISFASTYPGTPSSEIGNILTKIARKAGLYFEFSVNEKVALEVSAAAAASGLRSFVFMKHVGLNVAADALMSTAYTGVRGGMIILSADDPSMHSSQNEQDNRIMAQLAGIPVLEPSNPQEMKDFMIYGITISEQYKIPVMIRTTTRVSHMRGVVQLGPIKPGKKEGFFSKEEARFNIAPAFARKLRQELVEKLQKLEITGNTSPINRVVKKSYNRKVGIITSGVSFNYALDIINELSLPVNILKLGLSYPFPREFVQKFISNLESIIIVEEVEPFLEKEILSLLGQEGWQKRVYGKLDGTLPRIYEYNPDIICQALTQVLNIERLAEKPGIEFKDIEPPLRPPVLCPGCPHRSTIYAIKKAVQNLKIKKENIIYSNDIGCYTLAMQPPYYMADYCICMGSSIGVASGLSKATKQKIVSLIGDSTFFHAGIPPLINAVHQKANIMVVILDNQITAMTGGQPNPSIPIDGWGEEVPAISIEALTRATGAGYVRIINPENLNKAVEVFKEGLQHEGVSVIISRSPCIMLKKAETEKLTYQVNQEKCTRCQICLKQFTCPALFKKEDGSIHINYLLCTQCGYCIQVCPQKAIEVKK
ncbi:MAG: indolepyruvate ferredoxin oxidoreductase subunit alpha [Atribacterota bacterium]|nr:indolepyruvate ferredoxin oxidoreductase subunit alpha [Atribacterota bacterium]MDD5637873.1 indolepyruvate ferredoxin oxidoreductase subunit alpha [Atribacterota bacterium]